jgi:hypothetical protein
VLAWRNYKGKIAGKKVSAERTYISYILSDFFKDLLTECSTQKQSNHPFVASIFITILELL